MKKEEKKLLERAQGKFMAFLFTPERVTTDQRTIPLKVHLEKLVLLKLLPGARATYRQPVPQKE